MKLKFSDFIKKSEDPLIPSQNDVQKMKDFFVIKKLPSDLDELIEEYGVGMIEAFPSFKFYSPSSNVNNFFSIFRDAPLIFNLIDENSPKKLLELKKNKKLIPVATSLDGDILFYSIENSSSPHVILTDYMILSYEEYEYSLSEFLFHLYKKDIRTTLPVADVSFPLEFLSMMHIPAYRSKIKHL